MRKKNYKVRCEKRSVGECNGVCRTYVAIQYAYADILSVSTDVVEIWCNMYLNGLEGDHEYTTDFVCTKQSGDVDCIMYDMLISRYGLSIFGVCKCSSELILVFESDAILMI